MDEEATYNKLKSITKGEAEILCEQAYTDLCIDLELEGKHIKDGVPFHTLRDRADAILKPYGWTYDRIYPFYQGNFS
jgi:hypothetical protein